MRIIQTSLVALLIVVLAACTTAGTADRTQLSADEVRATFVGVPWRSPNGRFLFSRDGTYTYVRNDGRRGGPWSYTLRADGVIVGATTNYTFFRRQSGSYVYRHSRTGRIVPVTFGR